MFNLLCLCCRLLFVRVALILPIVTITDGYAKGTIVGIHYI
jgi:hypothetical protein